MRRRRKRNYASSSDEGGHSEDDCKATSCGGISKPAPTLKTPRREGVSRSVSSSKRSADSRFGNFDEIKRACAEFDLESSQLKVSRCNGDLWVEKYKPGSLEELAVHKKKVEQVKQWFEDRLNDHVDNSSRNVIILSGQAGVGKSATIYSIANHLGAEVHEWKAPVPTMWHEHLHNSNSGLDYMSKLDQFERFVEKLSKYGLVSLSSATASPSPVILLIDDLPVVNGKAPYERLLRCLHFLLRSVRFPTAILFTEYGRCESAEEQYCRYWGEIQLSLENAGAFKVAFNPVTSASVKRVLSKICKLERIEVSKENINLIADASEGDIRQAITSLQYFSISSSVPKENHSTTSLPFGKDGTLSLFHALGKFLHNKRDTESSAMSDCGAIVLKEKFFRHPLKMDTPEWILSQAHGQAKVVADFLHENVVDFVSMEAIEDAWIVDTYLSDSDLLLSSTSKRNSGSENMAESAAASVAVRGVLFGNSHPASSRWHSIRRPALWQVEQSLWSNKLQLRLSSHGSLRWCDVSVMATEFKPLLRWLQHGLMNEDDDHHHDDDNDDGDDEIEEDW